MFRRSRAMGALVALVLLTASPAVFAQGTDASQGLWDRLVSFSDTAFDWLVGIALPSGDPDPEPDPDDPESGVAIEPGGMPSGGDDEPSGSVSS